MIVISFVEKGRTSNRSRSRSSDLDHLDDLRTWVLYLPLWHVVQDLYI